MAHPFYDTAEQAVRALYPAMRDNLIGSEMTSDDKKADNFQRAFANLYAQGFMGLPEDQREKYAASLEKKLGLKLPTRV